MHTCIEIRIKSIFNFVAIVESLLGSDNRPTDSVNVNRVSTIYSELVEDLQNIDFVNFEFITMVGTYTYSVHIYFYTYTCLLNMYVST